MVLKRVIPCLDVDGGRVVKGTNFVGLRDAGDPVELAERYDAEGADELVFLDITASHEKRDTIVELARRTADNVFIPFTIGGGIRSVEDAQAVLDAGADKVSVNSSALARPELLGELADHFGAQCVVIAIDAKRHIPTSSSALAPSQESDRDARSLPRSEEVGEGDDARSLPRLGVVGGGEDARFLPRSEEVGEGGEEGGSPPCEAPPGWFGELGWDVYVNGGRTRVEGREAVEWAREAVERGAGEVLLTSMDRDGTNDGYDIELTRAVADAVSVPVIASGGAGKLEHLSEAISSGHADAVLCASIFHYGAYRVRDAKRHLAESGIPVRR